MQVESLNVNHNKNFTGFKQVPVKENGKTVIKYLLKKKEIPVFDTLSFITALTSMIGFAIGGSGLTSDWLNDLTKNKKAVSSKNGQISNEKSPFHNFDRINDKNTNIKDKNTKNSGAKTIIPGTKFSKMGLVFAKVGIAFSGIAGIFNGISMRLPLMSLGETLNLCASPIIETPLGTGLFGIALSFVFSGRALENDPKLKLDPVKLKNANGIGAKAKYVLQNMAGCAKSVVVTGKEFVAKTSKIFNKDKTKRKEGINFFRDSVFSIKPKKIVVQEFLDHEGKVIVKTGFQNNPYLMHAASIILALGGTTLALSSIFKQKTGQKVGLRTYETGGSFDNMSLSRAGLEKFVMAPSGTAGRISGALQGLCGVTILAGQPGVDEKWGRGIQWVGSALLFAVFAVERFPKAFHTVKGKDLPQALIRQWEVDLTKLYSKSELHEKLAGSEFKTRLDSIINSVKQNEDFEDKNLATIVNSIKNVVENKEFNSSADKIQSEFEKLITSKDSKLTAEKLNTFFKHDGNDGDAKEITSTLKKEVDAKFVQT